MSVFALQHLAAYAILAVVLVVQASRHRARSKRLAVVSHELREAQRIAQVGTVRWDFLRDRVGWSDEYARLLALEPGGTMTGAEFQAMLLPEYEASVVESERIALEASRRSGRPERREITYKVRARDGRVLEVEALSELLADEAGNPIRLVSTVRDVTEQAAQRRELHESERTLAAAIRVAELGIFRENFQSGEIYWSEGFHELIGRSPELGPGSISEVMGENGAERLQQRLDELTAEAVPFHVHRNTVDAVLTRGDGVEINVRVAVELTFDAEGRPHVMSGVLRDVTEEIERETALKAAVAEAESANAAKTEFLAVMSHELRTPMNGVLGMLGALDDTPLSSGQRDQLAIARSSANALLVILNDILDVSKIEAGRLELEEGPFELHALVRSVIHLYAQKAQDKGIVLDSEIGPGIPEWIEADSGRIRQVLANLVSNAVKFTAKGSVILSVERHAPTGDEPLRLRFRVTDTGIGIPVEHQEKVFGRFEQLGASYAHRFGGTGLGLSISRSLAELMGGEIGFESAAGDGSQFWMEVPVRVGQPHAANAEARPLPDLPRMRILVAEDNSTNQIVARSMLERLGQNPELVMNGAEAIEAVERFDYDMVFMDVSMPVMDGTSATKRIRALGESGAALPVIALTAHVRPDQQAYYREAGFDDVLTKPIIREQLVRMLDRWKGYAEDRARASGLAASLGPAEQMPSGSEPEPLPVDAEFPEAAKLRARISGLREEFGADVADEMMQAAISDVERHRATLVAEAPETGGERPCDLRRRALHSITGISGTLGCEGFADRCRRLEGLADARAEAPEEYRVGLEEIEAFHAELRAIAAGAARRQPETMTGGFA